MLFIHSLGLTLSTPGLVIEFYLRYASTLVTSTVENTEEVAREVFFNVILPETAFISR